MATLLIVDDSDLARGLVRETLRRRGHEVREAESGARALQLLAEGTPDLILLDLLMPGMGGLDVLRVMRARNLAIPVIVAVAGAAESTREACLRRGAADVLAKPFDAVEVCEAVDRVLGVTTAGLTR